MPIFEADEEVTAKEMRRQQRDLTSKVFRLESKKLWESTESLGDFQGGNRWEVKNCSRCKGTARVGTVICGRCQGNGKVSK